MENEDNSTHFNGTVMVDNTTQVAGIASVYQTILWSLIPFGLLIFVINCGTLVLLFKARLRHGRIRVLYVNMALSDAMAGLLFSFNCWVYFYPTIVNCAIRVIFAPVVILVSHFNAVLLTLDRAFTITFPFKYPVLKTTKCASLVSLGIWVVCLAKGFISYLAFSTRDPMSCGYLTEDKFADHTICITLFFISMATVVGSYIQIVRHVMKTHRIIAAYYVLPPIPLSPMRVETAPGGQQPTGEAQQTEDQRNQHGNTSQEHRKQDQQRRLQGKQVRQQDQQPSSLAKTVRPKMKMRYQKIVSLIIGLFVLCYLPFQIVLTIYLTKPSLVSPAIIHGLLNGAFFLMMLNSLVNPLLYTWKTRELRIVFLKTFCTCN